MGVAYSTVSLNSKKQISWERNSVSKLQQSSPAPQAAVSLEASRFLFKLTFMHILHEFLVR